MVLNGVSEVTQLYLAILAVILGAMVIGTGPRSRKSRYRTTVPSSRATSTLQAEKPLPATDDLLASLAELIAELRVETSTDETKLNSLALLKETADQNGDADIHEFVDRLFENARRLACLRYLIEHTTGSDRIALGNMKLRAMKQTQSLERELEQLREKAMKPSNHT